MLGVDHETLIFHEGYDFDDEHEGGDEPMDEEHPMWRSERISLTSVGIDIGSSTSHLIFSRLILRRQGLALSSRFVVVKREILGRIRGQIRSWLFTVDSGKGRFRRRESLFGSAANNP